MLETCVGHGAVRDSMDVLKGQDAQGQVSDERPDLGHESDSQRHFGRFGLFSGCLYITRRSAAN
ncbi:hypothetical protein DBR24_16435 [Pseudomonas sp. HMWF006]|nr:hypothetical protein DBR24_16435 [Pseudomonas sp. HMWF006]PTT60889.1 hypothetical protein DBR26_28155 [Pseudomonas sp. HMWF007]PTT90280.1 hypothetical protein DBR29_13800 [Pseudomonas sp. HMWF005]RON60115.1 hypothetical protein BK669_22060 [Pseudomonas fluorescens]